MFEKTWVARPGKALGELAVLIKTHYLLLWVLATRENVCMKQQQLQKDEYVAVVGGDCDVLLALKEKQVDVCVYVRYICMYINNSSQ